MLHCDRQSDSVQLRCVPRHLLSAAAAKLSSTLFRRLQLVVLQVKQGEKFVTDTDTEVIPKLCKYVYNNLQEPMHFPEVGSTALGCLLPCSV